MCLCVFPSILPYPGCHQAVINAEAEVGVIPLSQECRCWVSADSVCLSLTMQLSGVEGGGERGADCLVMLGQVTYRCLRNVGVRSELTQECRC